MGQRKTRRNILGDEVDEGYNTEEGILRLRERGRIGIFVRASLSHCAGRTSRTQDRDLTVVGHTGINLTRRVYYTHQLRIKDKNLQGNPIG